jgi:hypothetical protein
MASRPDPARGERTQAQPAACQSRRFTADRWDLRLSGGEG